MWAVGTGADRGHWATVVSWVYYEGRCESLRQGVNNYPTIVRDILPHLVTRCFEARLFSTQELTCDARTVTA